MCSTTIKKKRARRALFFIRQVICFEFFKLFRYFIAKAKAKIRPDFFVGGGECG